MDVVHQRAAGIDISKRDAKVCVRVPGSRPGQFTSTVTTWGATTNQILELREFLQSQNVSIVVMESTSDYWRPFYYLLEETLPLSLVNAKEAKNVPGRKTDVSDAAWLAKLAAYGMLRSSFVPPEPIRQLRDLTRARTILTRDRSRELARLEKFLESSGIKLSSVVSDLDGASARAMLDALVAGEQDPRTLALLARGRMKTKSGELTEALTGRFTKHHRFLTRLHLQQIDAFAAQIRTLDERIESLIAPFRVIRDLLTGIPGVSTTVANIIIAETGGQMSVFPNAAHLASWAGVSPGSNESAGRVKSTRTRPGNRYLKGALGVAAIAACRSKNTYLAARFRRIQSRRGGLKAIVAIQRSILTACWNMITNGEAYDEPGGDYYMRRNPTRTKNRALNQLRTLGYHITLTPTTST